MTSTHLIELYNQSNTKQISMKYFFFFKRIEVAALEVVPAMYIFSVREKADT